MWSADLCPFNQLCTFTRTSGSDYRTGGDPGGVGIPQEWTAEWKKREIAASHPAAWIGAFAASAIQASAMLLLAFDRDPDAPWSY
jgi:hypothetical protein